MKLDFRQRLLTTTLMVGASMAASPVYAQTTTPPDSATGNQPDTVAPQGGQVTPPTTNAQGSTIQSAQDIVITGTRIPQPNLTSASPVTVLSSQEVKLAGTTRTEDLINSLPQAFATQGSNISNGSTGTASVNLRNLGSARTLVLVNGRRLQPGDPRAGSIADINFVPASIVKRVDVLTGGASSVYGADAVAGVVNFIMDTNFTGLRIDAQASTFMHYNDAADKILNADVARGFRPPHGWSVNGGAQDISAAFGANFDDNRGHVMAYATYRKQDAVLEATRDYAFCALAARTAAQGGRGSGTPARDFDCGGSATSATGTFFTNIGTFQTQGNQFVPGSTPFNFGPYNFFQRPDERYTFGTFAEYEIAPGARPYLEAMFMNDTSNSQIAPSGNFFNTNTINCDNPLLSQQQHDIICQQSVYDPQDANPAGIPLDSRGRPIYFSQFSNLVGGSPIFGPDPDGTGPLPRPILGFNAPTVFTDALGNQYNQGIAYVGRRNVEGGGRSDHLEHTAWRIVAGIKGDVLPGVSYDTYFQYGTTRLSQVYQNDFSVTRLLRAMDVVANPDIADGGIEGVPVGAPVCRSALLASALGASAPGADANCVPYNVYQTGGITPEALAYLQIPLIQRGHTSEIVANANVTLEGGEYGIQTPWADRGVGLNVGVEYRKESIITEPDASFQLGDGAGQGAPTLPIQCDHGVSVVQGGACGFDVREGFAELQVPIVSHSFIDEFTLTGGYRYSDYKVAGRHFNTDTYKVEARLAPVPDILARASYNRAVRAPNAVELFFTPFVGLGGTEDPCAGATPGFTAAQCAFTGVTAAQYGSINANPANQYNAEFSGSVDLKPETADTYTAGVLLKPRWVPGLAISADYFDIKVNDLVGIIPYQFILNNCATTGDPATCSLINRNPNNGSLWQGTTGFVEQHNTNIGSLRTQGIDVNGSYSRRLGGMGTLNVSMVGTWLKKLETDIGVPSTTAGLDNKYDCAGFYGNTCGTPSPEWRHSLRVGFTMPNGLGISGRWRYFGAVDNDAESTDPDLGSGPGSARPANAKINAQSYFDLSLSARLADKYNFRLGANNVFDKQPPIVGGEVSNAPFGNGNTYPQVYDALGRYLFAGVTIDF
jgi:outer membrane receptor protein involved in Fe transport